MAIDDVRKLGICSNSKGGIDTSHKFQIMYLLLSGIFVVQRNARGG